MPSSIRPLPSRPASPAGSRLAGAGIAAVFVGLLAACATPASLSPGTAAAAVRGQWGEPSGRHRLADGRSRWEYATGPQGGVTYMLDFGPDERLLRTEQVLTEANFERVRVGDPVEALRQTLGRPAEIRPAGLKGGSLWSYRYLSTFCQWFQVVIGDDQRVREVGYGPDPKCDDVEH